MTTVRVSYVYAVNLISSFLVDSDRYSTVSELTVRLGRADPVALEDILADRGFSLSHVDIVRFEGGDVDYLLVFIRK